MNNKPSAQLIRRTLLVAAIASIIVAPSALIAQTTTPSDQTNPPSSQANTPPAQAGTTTTTTTTTSGTAAPAASDQTVQLGEFVVYGERASLASAAEIKRNSDQIVDSIVADDIDKLPDTNVAQALERITGVQVGITAGEIGGNGGLAIRGLTEVENTIDGREILTIGGNNGGVASGQRTFNYQDLASALVESIDVYKTSAADQVEGGLGGLIDVHMRKPFDFSGLEAAVTVGTTYGTLDNQDRPNYNVLFSDRWKTGIGDVGVLVDVAYQARPWREDNTGMGNPTPAPANMVSGSSGPMVYNNGFTLIENVGVHTRTGVNATVQWKPSSNLEFYAGMTYEDFWIRQTSYELSVSLPASAAVAGSGVLFPGSATDIESASFSNVTGSAFGITRDTTDRENQYFVGGKWTMGDLSVKFDLSRAVEAYDFYNNGAYMSVPIAGFSYSVGGSIPAAEVHGVSLLDENLYNYVQVYNRLDPSTGYETAGTLDAEYKLPTPFITSIMAGFRYSGTEADDGTTGLFLGAYNPPAADRPATSQPSNLTVVNPIQNYFSGYPEPNPVAFLVPSTSNMRNAEALLTAYGDTTTTANNDATVNPLSLYHIDELNAAFYVMPKFAGNIGGLAFDGNFGLRAVHTTEDLDGNQTVTPAADNHGVAIIGPLSLTSNYMDWLPSANFRLKITDSLFLRLAASKTITRPSFSQMSPSLTLNANPVTPSLDSGSQGNPDLKPMRADNYDVSVEKYFSKDASVYVAGFYKSVTGFPESIVTPEVYGGLTYEISTFANLNPATVKGTEIGYQEFFDFLPAPFDGFGFQANYTYVDSTTPSTVAGLSAPLQSLSKNSYNAILMYEKGPFSARVAWNYRSAFYNSLITVVGFTSPFLGYTKGYGDLDAALSYNVTKNVEINIQGTNLTNTMRETYYTSITRPSNFYLDDVELLASLTIRL
jgi:iron complex outermembrane receptor protein